jgi:hypothetical protein
MKVARFIKPRMDRSSLWRYDELLIGCWTKSFKRCRMTLAFANSTAVELIAAQPNWKIAKGANVAPGAS